MTLLIVTDDDTCCIECGSLMRRGSVYSERLLSADSDSVVVEIICLNCAHGTGR